MDQFASNIVPTESYGKNQDPGSKPQESSWTEEKSEIESWWKNQFWTLFVGLACGIGVNMLSRLWKLGRYPAMSTATPSSYIQNIPEQLTNFSTNNKMVLVVRTDLNMSKGKVAAQCAHAAVACYKKALKKTPTLLKQWELFGQAKVTLKAPNYEDLAPSESDVKQSQDASLEALASNAHKLGIVACIIHDAGRTQLERGSSTVLGIGPATSSTIDSVTGNLKLY